VSVSPEEAVAIIAALERHLQDTARAAGRPPRHGDRWTAAARLQDASGDTQRPNPWGEAHPWIKS
jgi:hypothetical protein